MRAALARELGLPLAPSPAGARRAALARTAGYFTVLVAAEHLARTQGVAVSATTMALLAAIGIDAWQGARAASWVPVARLRQPFAPALLESALAARGIEARTSGRALLGLLQSFTPFAGATVLVAEADAERARAVLEGEASPPPRAASAERAASARSS